MRRAVDILVGLQWGSEGKGRFAADMAHSYAASVRVGGPNAGHTFMLGREKFVNRSVPCAWINQKAKLFIGAGAVVRLEDLAREIEECEDRTGVQIVDRLIIDPSACVISLDHIASEQNALGYMGSTMHGIGDALIEKIARRDHTYPLVSHMLGGMKFGKLVVGASKRHLNLNVAPVAGYLHDIINGDGLIMLEGTQGTMLSLDHGEWPYVTSRNAIAASLLDACGLSPLCVREIFGVMRTYPIRVGGSSGPMGNELTWTQVARRAGLPETLSERTTVTGRVRRVAEINLDQLAHAVRLNGCTRLLVAFADYIDGTLSVQEASTHYEYSLAKFIDNEKVVAQAMAKYAAAAGVPIFGVSWGPLSTQSIIDYSQLDR